MRTGIATEEPVWIDNKDKTTSKSDYRLHYLWIVQNMDEKFSAWDQGTDVGKFDTLDLAKDAVIKFTDKLFA